MVWRKDLNQSTDNKEVQHLKDKIRIIKEHIVDRNNFAIKLQNRSDKMLIIEQKKVWMKHPIKNEVGETLKHQAK